MFLTAFPKTDLHGGHIGDGYPVCSDLPDDLHLRKGATYVYRGYEPVCNKDSVLTGGDEGGDSYIVMLDVAAGPSLENTSLTSE